MSRRFFVGLVLVGLFLPLAASAQIQVTVVTNGGAEHLINSFHDTGSVAAGDTIETVFRLRNTAPAPAVVHRLSVAGAGFLLLDGPALPASMAAGAAVGFRVRFRAGTPASYSATLQINDRLVLLRAVSAPTVTVLADLAGQMQPLVTGQPIDFGRVERGRVVTRRVELRNDNATTLAINRILVGEPFSGSGGTAAPLTLAARESVSIEVAFAPERAGAVRAVLDIDGRVFPLLAVAVEPPFPEPRIRFSSATPASGQQVRVAIGFPTPSRAAGSGALTISLQPDASASDDPAVLFPATGARRALVTVAEGAESALLEGQPEIVFQTGTTAGTLTFFLELGEQKLEARLTLLPAPAVIDTTRGTRTATSVEVHLAGFDNTRSLARLSFRFFDRQGNPLGQGPLEADAANEFQRYFRDSQFGGLFALRAVFPVAGDTATVGAVEVGLSNSAGVSRTQRIAF